MMPPPSHLADYVMPDDPWLDETPLHATLKCPCGSRRFSLLYVGELSIDGEHARISYIEKDGGAFYRVRARCTKCSKQIMLYDKDYHGWNGFVAFDPARRRRPRPTDIGFRCARCGGDLHRVRLHIITEGRDDFVAQAMNGGEGRSEFEECDWPSAFGYISFDLTCVSCELETKDWAADEAA